MVTTRTTLRELRKTGGACEKWRKGRHCRAVTIKLKETRTDYE